MKRYVLDTSALMTFFEDHPGADKVEELLRKAAETKRFVLMSVINWGEVYYSVWLARGEEAANEKLRHMAQLPIEVVDVDISSAKLAATLTARFGLAYANCFAAALARTRRAQLVATDSDFKCVESQINILWPK